MSKTSWLPVLWRMVSHGERQKQIGYLDSYFMGNSHDKLKEKGASKCLKRGLSLSVESEEAVRMGFFKEVILM